MDGTLMSLTNLIKRNEGENHANTSYENVIPRGLDNRIRTNNW